MRILACADLHGIGERVERTRGLIAETSPDILLLAGDLAGYDDEGATLDALRSPVPVLGVGGNMDGAALIAELSRRGWLLGDEPRTVGGFTFGSPAAGAACDVLVSGDDSEAKKQVLLLVEAAGMVGWDAGPLPNAVVAEGMTSVLIGINRRYKMKGAGIRITGVDQT